MAAGLGTGLVLVGPAIGQPAEGPAPKSLLPKGFAGPSEPPPPAPAAPLPGVVSKDENMQAGEVPPVEAVGDMAPLPGLDSAAVRAAARDPLAGRGAAVGVLTPASGGHGAEAFAGADGRFLVGLARRVQAPIASRWAAIALRRAFLSEAAGPLRLSRGDWVAARAMLLVRMGDVEAAKLLVDRLPVDAYSRATYLVAGQVALAAADIGALCPIARTGRELSRDPLWELAMGMCAALEGDDISAAALFDRLQQRPDGLSAFDVRLGERVATMAGGGGRATGLDWREAPPLTPYRFGVALASGVAPPAPALEALGPARHGWLVRQPALAPEVRLLALPAAAIHGSVSSRELVSGVALLAPEETADGGADSPAARLRTAYAGAGVQARLAAMQAIWTTAVPGLDVEQARYAGLIQTAPAVARLPVNAAAATASADLIASLLAAGEVKAAQRWWPVASKAPDKVRARAWALLAVSGGIAATPDGFRAWLSDSDADERQAARLFSALAGLGMTQGGGWSMLAQAYLPASETAWSRAIRAAGRKGHSGAVALLAATGLQGRWAEVPAAHIMAIAEAMRASGRGEEARLFAAEALTRS